jgi:two pore calcium channel protein 1
MGMSLFAFSVEGGETFTDIRSAFWTLFITLTTSNFPNVMLPSYNTNRMCAAFFLTYLVIGLFLLMNLVLAIIYSAY